MAVSIFTLTLPGQILFAEEKNTGNIVGVENDGEITINNIKTDLGKYEEIGLKEIKELLIENNQELKVLRSRIKQSTFIAKSENAKWSPRIDLTSNSLPKKSDGETNNSASGDTSTNKLELGGTATIEWDLINPTRKADIKLAKENLTNAKLLFESRLRELYLETLTIFFQLQRSYQNIIIAEQAIEVSEKTLLEFDNRFTSGISNKLEVLEGRTELYRNKKLLEQRLRELRINQVDLAEILNINQKFVPKSTRNPVILGAYNHTLEESIIAAYEFRDDLKIKENEIIINKNKADSTIAAIKPKVTIYNSYSASTFNGESAVDSPNYNNTGDSFTNAYGGKFSWRIFDGGYTRQNYRSIIEKKKELEYQVNLKKQAIKREIENALIELNFAKQSIILSDNEIKSATESLDIALKRLEAGITTQREIVNLQSDVVASKSNYINSLTDYNMTIVQLNRMTGLKEESLCNLATKDSDFHNYLEKERFLSNCNNSST